MKKVLIIEDEPIVSFGYRLQIERMGFDVTGVAYSAEDAELLIAQERPDVIIMDVYLKGPMTGLELAQRIHLTDPIPILFLTASTRPDVLEAIRGIKGARYLAKPISTDGLMDMLEQLIRADVPQ